MLEQVQLNFSFRNKFIILLPYDLLVENNTFSKMCIFKSLVSRIAQRCNNPTAILLHVQLQTDFYY